MFLADFKGGSYQKHLKKCISLMIKQGNVNIFEKSKATIIFLQDLILY